ncbi:type I-C CRISPR-associated protein Cas8c/Csd1 [Pseudoalteromonas rubra]|uniref:type I-C CRISPR-associated protein Cas8c/Csd1 n=1 Tax=Pseudoalteromonas rubra TaxID=43658 RepID=UPI000F797C5E|nr:type I-C CRISPR-associated protein Cas8c/Csd1 [Pseudoalteromonas rubra]
MSWLAKLYDTYEQALQRFADAPLEEQIMPISHTPQTAHIHVRLNGDGVFLGAEVLPEKTQIVLPATEKSAGRSSGLCAHPLADKIQYTAGDYEAFGGIKKPGFDLYLTQLKAWADSEFCKPPLQAVLRYVEKRTLVVDLVEQGVLHAQDGTLLTEWSAEGDTPALLKLLPKQQGKIDQGAALVCWSVEQLGELQSKTWLDPELQQSWIAFDAQNGGNAALCMVTGEELPASDNHPAKLRHSGDKAKLISSNDSSGYTYRGRFSSGHEASSVSFEATQKAHNALRWLLARQGHRTGDQVYLAWAISGKAVPDPAEQDWLNWMTAEPEVDHTVDLGERYANNLNHYFNGLTGPEQLEKNEQIAMIGIDSATPGRMGILYYRETVAVDFLARLKQWQLDLGWWQRVKLDDKNSGWRICAPSLYRTLDATYGDVLKSSESLKKNLVARLYPCIVEGSPIPRDIMNNAFHRAVNRVAYKSDQNWLWAQNLGVACALIRGYHKRTKIKSEQKDYEMALQEDYKSRDYLFGRLLAVANKIEQIALSIGDSKRMTTAERYMNRFVNKPSSTWLTIVSALVPYQQRIFAHYGESFERAYTLKLAQITDLFAEVEQYNSDKKLSPEFLLGFHSQMMWLEQHSPVKGQWQPKATNKTEPSSPQTESV